jgi:hypothetical protein
VSARLVFLFAGLAVFLKLDAVTPITVSATTAPGYIRRVDAQGRVLPESYVFAKGHFYGGDTRDGSLVKLTFADIVEILAPNLAKQSYFPSKEETAAHLVLVVHWGVTRVYRNPQGNRFAVEDMNKAVAGYNVALGASPGVGGDPGAINMLLAEGDSSQQSAASAVRRNAVLLGYESTLEKFRHQLRLTPEAEDYDMFHELNEERYFVILMAYDNQTINNKPTPRPLWITRLSIRSPGRNFMETAPALSQVGADYFGRQVDGLVRVEAEKRGRVKLGEIEYLGTVESAPPAKPDK